MNNSLKTRLLLATSDERRSTARTRFDVLEQAAVALIVSGVVHGLLWLAGDAAWEGPLSARKPALFGISAGVTLLSLQWALQSFNERPWDRQLAAWLAWGLLGEVGLITLQYWRGVPSHFNRGTLLDAAIETTMLVLIAGVTLSIAYLTWRSLFDWVPRSAATAAALRWGLGLLLMSCLLGVVATVSGEYQLRQGRAPEYWGARGVLKFPHGAALHAIQTLPIVKACLSRLREAACVRWMHALGLAHLALVGFALWQTFRGVGRFELDLVGIGLLLAGAGALCGPFVFALSQRFPHRTLAQPRTSSRSVPAGIRSKT